MQAGGILAKHVHAFSFFGTIEQNDAILKLINCADGAEGAFPEGDGLCENLRCYSKIRMDERSGALVVPFFLDTFEVFTQQSSNNNVASSTHSDYKNIAQ